MRVGVLALQGAFAKHIAMLHSLGAETKEVRKPEDLKECDALIIPGGESTTIFKQIAFISLSEAIREFAQSKPLFGTCAGLILMSKQIIGDSMTPFGLIDICVERNAFGRQVESFKTDIPLLIDHKKPVPFPAVFIRAPQIKSCGQEVKILATFQEQPVFVQQNLFLGATFHPELSSNSLIHAYFLKLIKKA